MAYVYQHIRLDTNEVFYIGIGKQKYRSTDQNNRNKYWLNVVNKVGYSIEIIAENISYDEALNLERHLIKTIGRKDLGLGPLVNMTDGGEGRSNFKHSKESMLKTKNSEGYKNRNVSKHHLKGKTYEEIYGKEKAIHIKEKLSSAKRPEYKKGSEHHMFGKKRPDHAAKMKGKSHPHTNESKQKLSIAKTGVPRNKLTCPHCGKIGGDGIIKRWHFNNCKTLHN
jgi:hypothetical protein